MKTLLPVDIEGDSKLIFDAVCEMYVRVWDMARKRPSPLDIAIGPESINLIAAFDKFYNGTATAEQTVEALQEMFKPFGK